MKKWKMYFDHFIKNRIYIMVLLVTAAAAYGFMITHHAVGIDDTPYELYFQEGLAAIVGRWVLFLLNKIVALAEFVPYFTDFVGVLILVAAVIVWSTLFYSLLQDRIPLYGYLAFSCVFLSCPLISEVFVYHLHNGVALGYFLCGVSLCFFLEGLSREKKRLGCFAGSLACLWIALGCYESFMMVWLSGVCLILMVNRMETGKQQDKVEAVRNIKVLHAIGIAGVTALFAMILRSVTIAVITALFHLEQLTGAAHQRSVTEFFGWIFEEDALAEFAMGIKRTYLMYLVFGVAYYPIGIFVAATIVIFVVGIVFSIRKKDIRIILLAVCAYGAAFSLIVIEGKETYYRCAQFLPVLCGFGALLLARFVCVLKNTSRIQKQKWSQGCLTGLTCILFAVVIWNQCADMNRWFYMDWRKYEAAKETMHNVAYELEKNFDTNKPVAFTGIYEIPETIIEDAFVSYSSPKYAKMIHMTQWLDPHLLEKFYRSAGVWVVQQPMLSVIEWGRTAFGDDTELVNFFRMHGYQLYPCTDSAVYQEAENYSLQLPAFPKEGSIVDMGEYIIVHF